MKKGIIQSGRKDNVGLKLVAAFLGGVALGLLMSPFIKGIGNGSGNITYNYHWSGDEMPEFPDPDGVDGACEDADDDEPEEAAV